MARMAVDPRPKSPGGETPARHRLKGTIKGRHGRPQEKEGVNGHENGVIGDTGVADSGPRRNGDSNLDFAPDKVHVKRERDSSTPDSLLSPNDPQTQIHPSWGWNHPDELPYPKESDWTDEQIFTYLVENAFTVPPKGHHGTSFFSVHTRNSTVTMPARYRVPLLWASKYLWTSVKLVLPANEWEDYKLSILHVSRACVGVIEQAKDAMAAGVDRKWVCPMFDRILVRYRHHCLMSDPETVEKYWNEHGEEQYQENVFGFGKLTPLGCLTLTFFKIGSGGRLEVLRDSVLRKKRSRTA